MQKRAQGLFEKNIDARASRTKAQYGIPGLLFNGVVDRQGILGPVRTISDFSRIPICSEYPGRSTAPLNNNPGILFCACTSSLFRKRERAREQIAQRQWRPVAHFHEGTADKFCHPLRSLSASTQRNHTIEYLGGRGETTTSLIYGTGIWLPLISFDMVGSCKS